MHIATTTKMLVYYRTYIEQFRRQRGPFAEQQFSLGIVMKIRIWNCKDITMKNMHWRLIRWYVCNIEGNAPITVEQHCSILKESGKLCKTVNALDVWEDGLFLKGVFQVYCTCRREDISISPRTIFCVCALMVLTP